MIACNLLLSSSFSLPPLWAHTRLLSSNPNPSPTPATPSIPSPVHDRCILCRCRRGDSSLDPNAESVRAGRFRFRDESGSGEVDGDFGQRGSRRWWSEGNPEEDFKEEIDSINDDDDDGEQLWDKIWIFKVFKSYGYLLPAIIASILLATGPKAFLMALALPLGQSAISLAIDKLWGGEQDEPRTSPRIRRKPFSTASTDFRKQEQDDDNSVENKRRAVYQSWVATENSSDDGMCKDSERPSFGGWDELDQQRRQVRWRPPKAYSSSKLKSAQVKMGKLSKKGRYKDAPLFLRLLIAVFPFLGSWIRIL